MDLIYKFTPIYGDMLNLPTDKNHLNFKWLEPDCNVYFSVTQIGSGVSCHFSSDKSGMKKIMLAVEDFINFVFYLFDWCEYILAKIKLKKVEDIVKKCQFKKITDKINGVTIYMRNRKWDF